MWRYQTARLTGDIQFIGGNSYLDLRARKLYTPARIYEWKFDKGEWKLPFASPTGRVDFFGFVIIFEAKKKELTSMFYSLQRQRKHSEERSFCRLNTLVSRKCDTVKSD